MPDLYYNAMREALQRDMMQQVERNARLTERIHALEQQVERAAILLATVPFEPITTSESEREWYATYDAWKTCLE